jgi:hypothetical protein
MNNAVRLLAITGDPVPSFKNTKRAILDRNTGLQRTLTPAKIKQRMDRLEKAIVFALYSCCPTASGVTDSACLKQLRTALSGLSDDSLKEIPEFSFGWRTVPKGEEGVEIIIDRIE